VSQCRSSSGSHHITSPSLMRRGSGMQSSPFSTPLSTSTANTTTPGRSRSNRQSSQGVHAVLRKLSLQSSPSSSPYRSSSACSSSPSSSPAQRNRLTGFSSFLEKRISFETPARLLSLSPPMSSGSLQHKTHGRNLDISEL
jgi:hypothetical protein